MPLSPEQRAKGRQEQAKFLHRAADYIESLKGKEFETADELSDAFARYWRKLPERPATREPYEGIFDLTLPVEPANQPLFPAGFKIPETQLSAPNYPVVVSPVLGKLTITSGFMEPHGHSQKPVTRAIFGDGTFKQLPASDRNLGVDYYVEDHRILSLFNGEVLSVAVEGSYGNRCRIATDRHYTYNGKSYPVIVAYAHAEHFSVKQGQKVTVGQRLGTQGGTGAGGEPQYPDHVDLRLWIDTEDGIIDLSPNLFLVMGIPITAKKPEDLSPQRKAILDLIAWCEGTDNAKGYQTIFGYQYFSDFSKHPQKIVTSGGYSSDAAGRYQFLSTTWAECQRALKLPDFSPSSQDKAALYLIERRGVLNLVDSQSIYPVLDAISKEWASMPASDGKGRYGQPIKSLPAVVAKYHQLLEGK